MEGVHENVLVLISLSSVFFLKIKDEAFDEAEKKFRLQERLIKSFIRDISLYLQHIRVSAFYHYHMKNLQLSGFVILLQVLFSFCFRLVQIL